MANNYYSCVPAIAWILGHYFFSEKHYVWIAEEFYPYRLTNPKSSNPYLIYQDLYQPWKDRDVYDKFIIQLRLNIRKGVQAQEHRGLISSADANRLKDICDNLDIAFFYPIIYRVDIDGIHPNRLTPAGSALTAGSSEYLIEDLEDAELNILFLDFDSDSDFTTITLDEIDGSSRTDPNDAMFILEKRC